MNNKKAAIVIAVIAIIVFIVGGWLVKIKKEAGKMQNKIPFEIYLSVRQGLELEAKLRNCSSKEQVFLYDKILQPCELILIYASGKIATPSDIRRNRTYPFSIYRESYEKLSAGREIVLAKETIKASGKGDYDLNWGPYYFAHLSPGAYKAYVIYRSGYDYWIDRESGQQSMIEDIWKGEIKSNQVEIRLP